VFEVVRASLLDHVEVEARAMRSFAEAQLKEEPSAALSVLGSIHPCDDIL
jgi:hypothetical protein